MEFEFHPAKSAANLEKHGIDFQDAQAIWNDPDRLEIPARSLDEASNSGNRPHRRGDVVGVRHGSRRSNSHHLRQKST